MSLAARLRRPVALATATVSLVGLLVELVHARSASRPVEVLVRLLSLSYEQNLPTWYASMLLCACAVVLAAIALDARGRGRRFARAWAVLAAGFALMSLDEFAELHEQLAGAGGGLVYFDWIVPAAAVVLALAVVFVPFLRALPPARRRACLLAGAVYLGGAVGMELPLGWWAARFGEDGTGYALIDWCEETLELVGAGWFLITLAVRWDERAEAEP